MISDQEILQVLGRDPGPLEDAAARLIAAANEAGGKDNVTAVLLRYRS
jgi:serine/threonine protein phosphatase PrpC